jgi:transposase InsO family protein
VVEVEAKKPQGHRKVAVDLGETQAITAVFDDGTALMYSGLLIKSIRRYRQKVRSKSQTAGSSARWIERNPGR